MQPESSMRASRIWAAKIHPPRGLAGVRAMDPIMAAQPEASQLHHPLALAYRRLGEIEKAREHAAGESEQQAPDRSGRHDPARTFSHRLYRNPHERDFVQSIAEARQNLAEPDLRDVSAEAMTRTTRPRRHPNCVV